MSAPRTPPRCSTAAPFLMLLEECAGRRHRARSAWSLCPSRQAPPKPGRLGRLDRLDWLGRLMCTAQCAPRLEQLSAPFLASSTAQQARSAGLPSRHSVSQTTRGNPLVTFLPIVLVGALAATVATTTAANRTSAGTPPRPRPPPGAQTHHPAWPHDGATQLPAHPDAAYGALPTRWRATTPRGATRPRPRPDLSTRPDDRRFTLPPRWRLACRNACTSLSAPRN